MNVTIFGAGAIGGIVGAHLAERGHDVTFVEVVRPHAEAIRDRGLRVTGAADLHVKPAVVPPERAPDRLSTVLLAVKARDTEEALATIAPRLAPDGCVVSLQNGLEEYKIQRTVGARRTVGALLTFGGHYASPGHVVYAGPGTFVLGELDGGVSARVRSLAATLEAFHPTGVTDNILGYLWSKEALGAFYFATALVDEDVTAIIARRAYRPALSRLVGEVVSVARAQGVRCVRLDGFDPCCVADDPADAAGVEESWRAQAAYWGRHTQTRTGVWRDLAVHRRRTEVDHILTPIVRTARERRVPVPRLERLVELVHEAEDGGRERGLHNLDEIVRVDLEALRER